MTVFEIAILYLCVSSSKSYVTMSELHVYHLHSKLYIKLFKQEQQAVQTGVLLCLDVLDVTAVSIQEFCVINTDCLHITLH